MLIYISARFLFFFRCRVQRPVKAKHGSICSLHSSLVYFKWGLLRTVSFGYHNTVPTKSTTGKMGARHPCSPTMRRLLTSQRVRQIISTVSAPVFQRCKLSPVLLCGFCTCTSLIYFVPVCCGITAHVSKSAGNNNHCAYCNACT